MGTKKEVEAKQPKIKKARKKATKAVVIQKEEEKMVTMERGLPSSTELKVMLDEETKRQAVLDNFIGENLKEGIDYGIIPGTGSKPSLFKPGGEKILSLFNLRAEWEKDEDTLAMINVAGAVAYKCNLINRASNKKVGEGRGVATPKEKSSWTANTQVKICEKRALIDAVLSTFALSSRYTQDVEDMPKPNERPAYQPRQQYQQTQTPQQPAPAAKRPYAPASGAQVRLIRDLLNDVAMSEEWLLSKQGLTQYKTVEEISSVGASAVIDQLKKYKDKIAEKASAEQGEAKDDVPTRTIDPKTGEVIEDAEIKESGEKRSW